MCVCIYITDGVNRAAVPRCVRGSPCTGGRCIKMIETLGGGRCLSGQPDDRVPCNRAPAAPRPVVHQLPLTPSPFPTHLTLGEGVY